MLRRREQKRLRNPLSRVEDEIARDIASVWSGPGVSTSRNVRERVYLAAKRIVAARRGEINSLLSSLYDDLENAM